MGGFSVTHLLIVLVVVVLVFGTKKLRNLGGDLGAALRGFRKGLNEDESPKLEADPKVGAPGVKDAAKDRVE
ncbi:MAG TPA: Sec-independent protein translocase subunit TatA [Xanthomonadales bacterium]|nr:Sec-independent protein translocase subunit TatA [Xanthomonadales bacterium]